MSRGRQPGLTAISAASDTRLLLPPVTVTTGVWPRRPQLRPFGGLKPWPDSSSKQVQAPRAAAVLLPPARPPAATPRSGLSDFRCEAFSGFLSCPFFGQPALHAAVLSL